jgi:DNA-binding MarR family transcriptional regulator
MREARRATTLDPTGEFPLDVATYLFHLFAVIARHRDARLDAELKPLNLTVSRHRALSVIATLAPCTMTELSEFTAVDRTTMTRTVDQLVEDGFVERATPPADRRQVVLTLTPLGRETTRRSLKVIYRLNHAVLAGAPEDLQRAMIRAQELFLANLIDDAELVRRLMFRGERGPR